MRLHYPIKGMSCAACVGHVERAVCRVIAADAQANVSLLTNSVSLTVSDDTDIGELERRLSAAVKQAGYELITQQQETVRENNESRKRIVSLLLSIACTLGVMYLSMGSMPRASSAPAVVKSLLHNRLFPHWVTLMKRL